MNLRRNTTTNNKTTTNVVRFFIQCCLYWILLFLMIGGTTIGKNLYTSFIDNKAGLPVVGYIVPLFLAGCIATLFSTRLEKSTKTTTRSDHPVVATSSRHSNNSFWYNGWIQPIRSILATSTMIHGSRSSNSIHSRFKLVWMVSSFIFQKIVTCFRSNIHNNKGDCNWNQIGFRYIYIPFLFYTITSIYRKVSWTNQSTDEFIQEFGNCWGLASIIGMGIILIPVSKHSVIIEGLGYSISSIVQIHIWIGRFVILGGIVHGICHLLRWLYIRQVSLYYILVPPPMNPCWTNLFNGTYQKEEEIAILYDHNNDDNKTISCFEWFRYWTGVMGFVFLLLIACTTLYPIRRQLYTTIFYTVHVVASPMMLLFVILHWNRSIIYISSSIIYYAACTFPVFVEQWIGCTKTPISIVSVETICNNTNNPHHDRVNEEEEDNGNHHSNVHDKNHTNNDNRSIISLTFQVSKNSFHLYRPGQYVQVYVPSISYKSHPFTVNYSHISTTTRCNDTKNPHHEDRPNTDTNGTTLIQNKETKDEANNDRYVLRILFRTTGRFTHQLANALLSATGSSTNSSSERIRPLTKTNVPIPKIYLDGFHGPCHRLEQVWKHHRIIFVAGGIGITPYLSLLETIVNYELLQQEQNRTAATNHHHPCSSELNDNDGIVTEHQQQQQSDDCYSCSYVKRKIILYWICRDDALIDTIKQQYLIPLMNKIENYHRTYNTHPATNWMLQIKIHCTAQTIPTPTTTTPQDNSRQLSNIIARSHRNQYATVLENELPPCNNNNNNNGTTIASSLASLAGTAPTTTGTILECNRDETEHSETNARLLLLNPYHPFHSSKFQVGTKQLFYENIPIFVSFALIGCSNFIVIWYYYTNVQENSNRTIDRLLGPIFIVVGSILISIFMNFGIEMYWPYYIHSCNNNNKNKKDTNNSKDKEKQFTLECTKLTVPNPYNTIMDDPNTSSYCIPTVDDNNREKELVPFEHGQKLSGTSLNISDRSISVLPFSTTMNHDGDVEQCWIEQQHHQQQQSQVPAIEERIGRPTIHEIINRFDDDDDDNHCNNDQDGNHSPSITISPGLFACGPRPLLDDIQDTVSERCFSSGCNNNNHNKTHHLYDYFRQHHQQQQQDPTMMNPYVPTTKKTTIALYLETFEL